MAAPQQPPRLAPVPPPREDGRLREALRRGISKAAALLVLAGVGAAAGPLLAPGPGQRIPYDEKSLGQVATATVNATRDYDIPDEETTRRKRDEAVAQVRPVYDLDGAAFSEVQSRIRDGFASMRSRLAALEAGGEAAPPPDPEPLREELVAKLQTPIEPRDFELLEKEGFSAQAEQAELELVAKEMSAGQDAPRPLVSDRELLGTDRQLGIFVRPLPEGSPGGDVVTDLDSVRDLAAARADVARAAMDLHPELPLPVRRALARVARGALRPNLTYDSAETERRRLEAYQGVKPVVIQIKKGEKIIGEGERIEQRHLLELSGMRAQARPGDLAQARLGGGLLAALLVLLCYRFGRRQLRRFAPRRKDALFLGILLIASLALASAAASAGELLQGRASWVPVDAFAYAIPMAAGAMLVRLCLGPELALLYAIAVSALFGVLEGHSLSLALFCLGGSILGADRVARAQSRAGVLRAGLWTAAGDAALVGCFALFGGRLWSPGAAAEALAALGGGALLTPILVLALLPLVEWLFGYTTDLRLLELSNLNHPALKELIVKAPGTYHHSILLGTLAEAAAQAIGANALLARVSAYYHDLGKGKNPLCFGENQKGQNRHDQLPPEESAALIRQHVLDGVELGRKYRLPRIVLDAIPQHHGTRLVGGFYQKALELRGPGLDDAPFRYPGPKPQSREAALVMLADGVEAASRALPQASPGDLALLARSVVDSVVADGQLDECDLTLRDLSQIGSSLERALLALHPARPDEAARPPLALAGFASLRP
ncbi:MAG: HD family phosphohydrolase, partial [Myxococcales bacterium]